MVRWRACPLLVRVLLTGTDDSLLSAIDPSLLCVLPPVQVVPPAGDGASASVGVRENPQPNAGHST
eukprot:3078287-Prorocentrum_lima.AAC.1